MPLHASHVSRTWDEVLTTAGAHVVSKMPEAYCGRSPRIGGRIAEPRGLRRPSSEAVTRRPLENAGEHLHQRPIGPPEEDVGGAVRQNHDGDPKHRITDRDVPEGTRRVPMVDVDRPRLEHLAPPGPGWPAYTSKKTKKKTSAGDVFHTAREKRIFPISPPMLGSHGDPPPLVETMAPRGAFSRESNVGVGLSAPLTYPETVPSGGDSGK